MNADAWRDEWGKPWPLVESMAAGESTARLNRRQRLALRILLGKLEKRRATQAYADAAHTDRKRLRRELDDMRQERDRERKRAELAESRQGRVGCGKVPIRNAIEAWQFIDLICSRSGETPQEYSVYTCSICEPRGDMLVPYHIGHVVSRAERAKRETEEAVDLDEARRRLRSYLGNG